MRKFLFCCSFMLFSVFVFTQQIQATCDYGYTPKTFTMSINGCDVEVNICYKCSPLGMTENWIVIQSFSRQAGCVMIPELNPSQILAQIVIEFFSTTAYLNELCGSQTVPPCPQPNNFVNIREPRCMYKQYYNNRVWYYQCQDAQYCDCVYNVCWDPQRGLVKELLSATATNGNTQCLNLAEPLDPTLQNPVTGCYFVATPCYP